MGQLETKFQRLHPCTSSMSPGPTTYASCWHFNRGTFANTIGSRVMPEIRMAAPKPEVTLSWHIGFVACHIYFRLCWRQRRWTGRSRKYGCRRWNFVSSCPMCSDNVTFGLNGRRIYFRYNATSATPSRKKLGPKNFYICSVFRQLRYLMANICWTKLDIDSQARALGSMRGLLHRPTISWTLVHKRFKIGPEFLPTLTILSRSSPSHTFYAALISAPRRL